jgi:outer membrane protein
MRQLIVGVLFSALVLPSMAAAEGLRVAYVDLNFALNNVEEGKKAKSILERDYKKKKTELEAANTELQALRSELETKRMVLSEEALRKKLMELESRQVEFQKRLLAHQQEWAKKEAELTNEILKRLVVVVKEIGKAEGYDFVLEKTESNILYAPAAADLTKKVVARYNKRAGRR